MNADVLKGKWKEIHGHARKWWGQLTDDELDKVNGRIEELVGLLQQRYGYAREAAEQEIDKRLKEYAEYADSKKKSGETVKSSSLD